MVERWLGPGEMARRLGVTPKALRIYERQGLVAPVRTSGGWRAYGPAQAARLHQIMALRSLGLSLKRIKSLLADDRPSLADILALQLESLTAQQSRIGDAIELVRLAMRTLNEGRDLTLDDLTHLTKETVMTSAPMHALKRKTESLIAERLPGADLGTVTNRVEEHLRHAGISKEDLFAEFVQLAAEGKETMRTNSDESEAAKDFVRKWRAAFADLRRTGPAPNDPATITMRDAMLDAMKDPAIAERLPFDPEVIEFLVRVTKAMKDRGELS